MIDLYDKEVSQGFTYHTFAFFYPQLFNRFLNENADIYKQTIDYKTIVVELEEIGYFPPNDFHYLKFKVEGYSGYIYEEKEGFYKKIERGMELVEVVDNDKKEDHTGMVLGYDGEWRWF